MMNRATMLILLGLLVSCAQADTLTLQNGQTLKGQVTGFAARKFEFKTGDGAVYSWYPLDVKCIVPDAPVKVSLKFSMKKYDSAEFVQYDHYTLRLKKFGQALNEPVITLMMMRLQGAAPDGDTDSARGASPGIAPTEEPLPDAPGEAVKPREWQRSGNWREMEANPSSVISHGEEVDIEAALKQGVVNIVQFHYPRSLASVREGNYIEALAAKRSNRLALLKVLVPDFNAPICKALGIRGLPQFWIYNAQGTLVAKLTDRFTESDIDTAIMDARRLR